MKGLIFALTPPPVTSRCTSYDEKRLSRAAASVFHLFCRNFYPIWSLCTCVAAEAERWMFDWNIMKCEGGRGSESGGRDRVSDGNNKRKF